MKRVKHTPHALHIKKEKSLPSAQSSFDRDDYPFYSLLAECNKDHIQHHLHRHQITITEPSSSSSSSSSLSSIKRCLTGHIHYKAVFCSPYELSCYCLIYMLCTIDIHHIPPNVDPSWHPTILFHSERKRHSSQRGSGRGLGLEEPFSTC